MTELRAIFGDEVPGHDGWAVLRPAAQPLTIAWNDASPKATGWTLRAGHAYTILVEEVIENDDAIAIAFQLTGDADQVVGVFADATPGSTPAFADFTVLASIQVALVGSQWLATNPYFVPRTDGLTLEAVITPGGGQSAGTMRAYLVDWGTLF